MQDVELHELHGVFHAGRTPTGACVDGGSHGWHGGHMVQLFANGTHEVVFDDGDRSSAVRHVRTIIPCRHACSALRCSSKARGSNPVA
jgi:hypothetical protein